MKTTGHRPRDINSRDNMPTSKPGSVVHLLRVSVPLWFCLLRAVSQNLNERARIASWGGNSQNGLSVPVQFAVAT